MLVVRETTERPEGIDAGNAILVGTQKKSIVTHLADLLGDYQDKRKAMAKVSNPYGDGQAQKNRRYS